METAVMPERPRRRLLRPEEAAEYLGIARWKLYELTRHGKLASVKEGRTIRFEQADLDAFIAAHRRPTRIGEVL
jgi:excisionase family DNA binding protein